MPCKKYHYCFVRSIAMQCFSRFRLRTARRSAVGVASATHRLRWAFVARRHAAVLFAVRVRLAADRNVSLSLFAAPDRKRENIGLGRSRTRLAFVTILSTGDQIGGARVSVVLFFSDRQMGTRTASRE